MTFDAKAWVHGVLQQADATGSFVRQLEAAVAKLVEEQRADAIILRLDDLGETNASVRARDERRDRIARDAERDAIVAWLRYTEWHADLEPHFEEMACDIERNEHRAKPTTTETETE